MSDTTIKKVNADHSPKGEMGQTYLVSGKSLAMRLWKEEASEPKPEMSRASKPSATSSAAAPSCTLEGQMVTLESGDSWLVPKTPSTRTRFSRPSPLLKRPRRRRVSTTGTTLSASTTLEAASKKRTPGPGPLFEFRTRGSS